MPEIMPSDTRYKISETEYFLQRIKMFRDLYINDYFNTDAKEFQDKRRRYITYYLSAFLCSAMSIIDYMRREYGSKPGFEEWNRYLNKQINPRKDLRELAYLNAIRVKGVHLILRSKDMPGPVTQPSVSYDMSPGRFISEEEALQKRNLSQQKPSGATETSASTTPRSVRLVFPKWNGYLEEDTEVVEFCERQLNQIKEIVKQCEEGDFEIGID